MPTVSFSGCLALLVLPLCLLACDDGPVGLVDIEDGVRAEVISSGITVENTRDEPVWAVAIGEYDFVRGNEMPQTIENPGRRIGEGERITFSFDGPGIRRSDAYYRVNWIAIKGEGDDRYIDPRGTLELER